MPHIKDRVLQFLKEAHSLNYAKFRKIIQEKFEDFEDSEELEKKLAKHPSKIGGEHRAVMRWTAEKNTARDDVNRYDNAPQDVKDTMSRQSKHALYLARERLAKAKFGLRNAKEVHYKKIK